MSELVFSIKTLLITALLISLMQLRISGVPIEAHAEHFVKRSPVAHFIQSAAAGGVMAGRDLYNAVLRFWNDNSSSSYSRASR